MSDRQPTTPYLSVLICVLNGENVIGQQLAALARQEADFDWEVVVANNGSTDSTVDVVKNWAKNFPVPLRVVDASERRGVCHARNIAARGAHGTVFAYCDADDEVQAGWVAAAGEALRQAPVVTGLTCIMNADGSLGEPVNPQVAIASRLQGGNFGIARKAFFDVGGFDEALPPYGNDDGELSLRLRKAGYAIRGVPEMRLSFRPTTDIRTRLRKIYRAGIAEVIIWHRHRDQPHFRRNLSIRVLSVRLLRTASDVIRTPGSLKNKLNMAARETTLRVAHLVGYLKWVRSGKVAPAIYVQDVPAREL